MGAVPFMSSRRRSPALDIAGVHVLFSKFTEPWSQWSGRCPGRRSYVYRLHLSHDRHLLPTPSNGQLLGRAPDHFVVWVSVWRRPLRRTLFHLPSTPQAEAKEAKPRPPAPCTPKVWVQLVSISSYTTEISRINPVLSPGIPFRLLCYQPVWSRAMSSAQREAHYPKELTGQCLNFLPLSYLIYSEPLCGLPDL